MGGKSGWSTACPATRWRKQNNRWLRFLIGNGDILMIRKKNNKRKKNRKKNKTKQNGQIRADTEVVSTTLDLTSGRFPARKTKMVRCVTTEKVQIWKGKNLCFNLQPSISRDSILTIDDFESADNQSDKATDKDDDSLETANEEVGRQIISKILTLSLFQRHR